MDIRWDEFEKIILKPIRYHLKVLLFLQNSLNNITTQYGYLNVHQTLLSKKIKFVIRKWLDVWVMYSQKFNNIENYTIKQWSKKILEYKKKIDKHKDKLYKYYYLFEFKIYKLKSKVSSSDFSTLTRYLEFIYTTEESSNTN